MFWRVETGTMFWHGMELQMLNSNVDVGEMIDSIVAQEIYYT